MSEYIEIRVPATDASLPAVVLKWIKRPGDAVAARELVLEIGIGDNRIEVRAPSSGVLAEVFKPAQSRVQGGEILGTVRPFRRETTFQTEPDQIAPGGSVSTPTPISTVRQTVGSVFQSTRHTSPPAPAGIPQAIPRTNAPMTSQTPEPPVVPEGHNPADGTDTPTTAKPLHRTPSTNESMSDIFLEDPRIQTVGADFDDLGDGGDSGDGGGPKLSPLVRRMLREHQIDPSNITGTGRDGRVTHRDVIAFIEDATGGPRQDHGIEDFLAERPPGEPDDDAMEPSFDQPNGSRTDRTEEIVENSTAWPTPTTTEDFAAQIGEANQSILMVEIDMSAVNRHRRTSNADPGMSGLATPHAAYFVKAAVEALRAVPEANGRWRDGRPEIRGSMNIEVVESATSGRSNARMIRDAQKLTFQDITEQLQAPAHGTTLDQQTTSGADTDATFAIIDQSHTRSLVAAPASVSETALISVGTLEKRVVVVERGASDYLRIAPMAYATLKFLPPVLDSFQANTLITKFVETLERWDETVT